MHPGLIQALQSSQGGIGWRRFGTQDLGIWNLELSKRSPWGDAALVMNGWVFWGFRGAFELSGDVFTLHSPTRAESDAGSPRSSLTPFLLPHKPPWLCWAGAWQEAQTQRGFSQFGVETTPGEANLELEEQPRARLEGGDGI